MFETYHCDIKQSKTNCFFKLRKKVNSVSHYLHSLSSVVTVFLFFIKKQNRKNLIKI